MAEYTSDRPLRRGGTLLGGVLIGALALGVGFAGGRALPVVQAQAAPDHVLSGVEPRARDSGYSSVVERVAPAVVTVRTERRAVATPTGLPESLREFFGGDRPYGRFERAPRQSGLGSGVIIRENGYIVTNNHVVEGADRVRVELADRRTLDATIVGTDPPSDLALLKVDVAGLPVVSLGDSDGVKVGDVVLAFGNPLGIGQTVTMGIVGAKGRATGVGDGTYEDFLQTDAPINQGNSGGALVNLRGELVGLSAQILSPSGGNIGLGFAIPVSMVNAVAEQLMQGGIVHRSKLGVTVQPITTELARGLGLPSVEGALVSGVEAGSPAQKAGLRQGDVIAEVSGRPVTGANALRNQIANTKPGVSIDLTFRRDGSTHRATAQVVEREGVVADRGDGPRSDSRARLGMTIQPLTPQSANAAGLPATAKGLVVADVDPAGAAAAAGIQPGDVITRVNNRAVTSLSDLQAALRVKQDRPALMLLSRDGASIFVALEPGA